MHQETHPVTHQQLQWFNRTLGHIFEPMTCFVKVCTEFLPISFDCVIQVDIYAVLDADNKIWFNKAHKKELLDLVLEKAKSRLLQSQTGQSLDKKERVSGQLRETPLEVVTGKNIKLGVSFRKCGVRYNSLLATADGLGESKVYQPLSCFKEKLIVYSYPLDRSSETSDVATASLRHHAASENIGKKSSKNSHGTIASFTHLTSKDSSEGVEKINALVAPSPQLISNDISEVGTSHLSAANKKKRSVVEELSTKKKSRRLSEFKFRRTRAIQVLCQRASPSVKTRIEKRRSRVLGLSCTDNVPEREDLQNRSSVEKTSEDVVGEKLDAHLGEKSSDIPEANNMNVLDRRPIGVFEDRSRNISGKNSKVVLGKKSMVASIENSENRKSMNLGKVTLVECAGRNELAEVITNTEVGEHKKCVATLQLEEDEEQGCCLTSYQKKINDKMEGFNDRAVHPSKKREHDQSDSVANALPVSKKLRTKKSREIEHQSSSAFPRPLTREVGQQCSVTMNRRSTEGIRWNSNGDIIGVRNSNSEIIHVSAGDNRRCSSDDFVQSGYAIKSSRCESAGSSMSKDCELDWKESDAKDSKNVTRSKYCTDNNTDDVLSNKANQMNQQIVDSDKDFRNVNPKRLPAQKSRRLATKKKQREKFLENLTFDSSPVFVDDPPMENGEIDFGCAPSDLGSVPSGGCYAHSLVDPQEKSRAMSKHLSTSDDGLGPFPLACEKQIPDRSKRVTRSTLEKDPDLSSNMDSQSVAKRQDNSFSSGSVMPTLCDAPLDNFSNLSASVTGSVETSSSRNSRSSSQNSVAMSVSTRLSGCDVAMTKSSRADVIVIDSDEEGDMEAQIKNVREVSDLSTSQLKYLVFSNETYLRKIFQGKTPCRRHQDYKAGKEKRRALSWNLPVGVFSDEQYSQLFSSLKELFCKEHEKYLDYVMMVLLPEMLVKIFMFIHDLSYEEAESRIEDNAMELSQRNRFSF